MKSPLEKINHNVLCWSKTTIFKRWICFCCCCCCCLWCHLCNIIWKFWTGKTAKLVAFDVGGILLKPIYDLAWLFLLANFLTTVQSLLLLPGAQLFLQEKSRIDFNCKNNVQKITGIHMKTSEHAIMLNKICQSTF